MTFRGFPLDHIESIIEQSGQQAKKQARRSTQAERGEGPQGEGKGKFGGKKKLRGYLQHRDNQGGA